jgi:SPP1 gp7 family putative phage head morphogenesis protein
VADKYWLGRLEKDQALARRAADQVSAEVKRAYRSQYLQTAKNLERLYAEAQSRGTLSRTKLWNYRRWRDMEPKLRQFCEAQGVIQTEKITKALDRVFEDVIGAGVEAFRQDKFLLPYDPRAVIDTAWSGEHYSARVWKNTGELAKRIEAEAQQIVMGDKSLGDVKRQLMRDFDVAWNQADRLVDTEVSYVMNRANLEQYKGYGFRKVEIVNLDVNTCEKCKALEGEVFDIHDAPVVPIHPRCHCSYCVPKEGDEAEITASGANLDEVYARKGVKGYDKPKQYAPKGAKAAAQPIPASKLESKVAEALDAFEKPEVKMEKNGMKPAV